MLQKLASFRVCNIELSTVNSTRFFSLSHLILTFILALLIRVTLIAIVVSYVCISGIK